MRWLLAGALLFISHPAATCHPHDAMARFLYEKHHEVLRSVATAKGTLLIELYVDDDDRSWTMVVVNRMGCSAILSAGEDWYDVKTPTPPLPGRPL